MAPSLYRFRHLVRRGDDLTTGPREKVGSGDLHLFPEKSANKGPPPAAVEEQLGQGTLEQIGSWLRSGALSPDDLVDLGRGWETMRETPELGEAADAAPFRPRVTVARVAIAVIGMGLLAGALLPKAWALPVLLVTAALTPLAVVGTVLAEVLLHRSRPSVSTELFEPPEDRER